MTPTADDEEIKKISSLANMQTHCGALGLVLTFGWLSIIHNLAKINVFDLSGSSWAFISIIGIGFVLPLYPLHRRTHKALEDGNIRKARNWLRFTSCICVVFISLLIYASGGPNSPFVVFYTMTFTLTLSQIKIKNWEWGGLALFLIPMVGGFYVSYFAYFGNSPPLIEIIPYASIKSLITNEIYFIMLAIGTCLSLIIPTCSIIYLGKGEKQ